MWFGFMTASIASFLLWGVAACLINRIRRRGKEGKISLFRMLFAGAFCAAFCLFMPVHLSSAGADPVKSVLLSLYHAMQIFTIGTDFELVQSGMTACPAWLHSCFQVWAALLFVLAPVFTFGFVLSLFKNISAYARYWLGWFRKMYIFSELNENSLALAADIRREDSRAGIVFHDVFRDNEERSFALTEGARQLGAICFHRDILGVSFHRHSTKQDISFFTIGADETENLDQSLQLIRRYRERDNTHLYVFSTKAGSELLLAAVDKGKVKVRRIHQVQSLINRVLYEQGTRIFDSALPAQDGMKEICAVVVGMGSHGTEMLKALSWYCQMDGYRLQIDAFDREPMAQEHFRAVAPELMDDAHNGTAVPGEAQYSIRIHAGCDVESSAFAERIRQLKQATYVFVSLGDDDRNIRTAVNLRMQFLRAGCQPVIQAVVTNSQQKQALSNIKNYRGQPYDISFIGDVESSFASSVIIDSELEEMALQRHLKWGSEEEFWVYEYNYRSSVAAALHLEARIHCRIPGAEKETHQLTVQEQQQIELLEHRRWNAYMRAEGYIYSGSTHKSSRNDLAKMHNNLVSYYDLQDADKRKDSSVGTK